MVTSPTHILVIEDDPVLAASLRASLEREGYRVTIKDSGLGLAIVKAVVDGHGGEIDVRSTEQGTRLAVTLKRDTALQSQP